MPRFDTPFQPYLGGGATVSPASSSATAAIPIDARQLRLANTGANICYVNVGNTGIAATTANLAVPAGETLTIRKAIGHDTIAYISAAGTTLVVTPGNGSIGQNVRQLASAPYLRALLLQGTAVLDEVSTLTIANATPGSTLSVVRGTLPAGLTLDSAAREITGTRTGAGTAFIMQQNLLNSPNDGAWSSMAIGDVVPTPTPTPTPAVSIVSINADGFSAEWDGTPPTAVLNEPITVQREGFSATGAPTTIEDVVPVIHRVRQPLDSPEVGDNSSYNGPFVYFDSRVAMRDWICDGDTIAGVTNNSTLVSPKPVCKWVGVDRLTIGNTLPAGTIGVMASHWAARLGQQVRCVEWIVSDGTTTLASVFTDTPSMSAFTAMARNVPAMMNPAIDITTLDEGAIFVRAKVYPWFGGSGAVEDSDNYTDDWDFCTQVFHKDVTKAAAPPLAVVKPSTGTSSGVISTDYATALATPFDTIATAMTALVGATYAGITGQLVDGARILLNEDLDVAQPITNAAARAQEVGAVTIARDPNVARGSARLLQWGGRPRMGSGGTLLTGVRTGRIHFEDLDIVRAPSTNTQVVGETVNCSVAFINAAFDNNSLASTIYGSNMAAGVGKWLGATITNAAVNTFWQGPNSAHWFMGVTGTAGTGAVSLWHMIGCDITGVTVGASNSAQGYDRLMLAFNVWDGITGTTPIVVDGGLDITVGMGIIGNLMVRTDGTTATMQISGDTPSTVNTTGIVLHNNTGVGFLLAGRWNNFYDETVATGRAHTFFSVKCNILGAKAHKFDISSGDPARQGGLAGAHGVAYLDNLHTDLTGFPPVYVGQNCQLPATQSEGDRLQPTYVDYRGITTGPVAGSVGGDYRVETGSLGADASTVVLLSHDLLGTARTVGDCLGAYSEAVAP